MAADVRSVDGHALDFIPGLLEMPGRQQAGLPPAAARPAQVWVAPDIVVPIDHITRRANAGLHLYDHRRAVRFPGVLIGPHPLDGYRRPFQLAGQNSGVQGSVVGPVVPVTARPFHMDHVDIFFFHTDYGSDRRPDGINALAVCPNR